MIKKAMFPFLPNKMSQICSLKQKINQSKFSYYAPTVLNCNKVKEMNSRIFYNEINESFIFVAGDGAGKN